MFTRVAIYYTPAAGAFETFGEEWLGWSLRHGQAVAQPPELAGPTAVPRRYGFHATLKAPFHLAQGATIPALTDTLRRHCAGIAPVALPGGLRLMSYEGFLALLPAQNTPGLQALAAGLVQKLDHFRAPLSDADRARRNPDALSPAQRENLERWGYPWIFDDFQFHMTLSGPLSKADIAPLRALAGAKLPPLPVPYTITQVSVVGEDSSKRFHLIAEVPLAG